MTVADLIKLLETKNPDLKVFISRDLMGRLVMSLAWRLGT